MSNAPTRFAEMTGEEAEWARIERFVEPCPTTGCFLWTGYTTQKGYGCASYGNKLRRVHRVAYERSHGPIPAGLVIDHICRVRSCVNPDHLRAVTPYENTFAPGSLAVTKAHAERTHCERCGNEYYRLTAILRECRHCKRARMRDFWAANKDRINEARRARVAARRLLALAQTTTEGR